MLSFANTNFTKLPEKFKNILTDVNLTDSKIKELPKNLTIHGDLIVGNAPIKKLPDDLVITGNLDLTNSNIKKIPNSACVVGKVIGNNFTYNPPTEEGFINDRFLVFEGKMFPYFKKTDIPNRYSNRTKVRDYFTLYYGILKSNSAIAVYEYKSEKWLFSFDLEKETLDQIRIKIEEKLLEKRVGNKYKHLSLKDTFNLLEIFPIYQQITDCCNDALFEFFRILDLLNLSTEEQYPLSIWIEGSKNTKYFYNYLFIDYFTK